MCNYMNCWAVTNIFLNVSLNYWFFNRTAEVQNLTLFLPSFFWVLSHFSETKPKQPNGTKHKLAKAASLPGRNGNPTFAAVAAGYDKSPGTRTSLAFLIIPNISWIFCYFAGVYFTHFYIHILAGGSGLPKVSPSKTDVSSNISISHTVVDSDGSDR